jgi:HAD superfamily hydrolase (TIGR01509 family)
MIIFGLGGVVADTRRLHSRLEAEICSEFGIAITPNEISSLYAGMSLREKMQRIFEPAGKPIPADDEICRRKSRRFRKCANEIVPIKGTVKFIKALSDAGVKLALASSSRRSSIKFVLEQLGMTGYFNVVVSSEDVEHGKPAPDMFLLAAQRAKVGASQCVVVVDGVSEPGFKAASAAGMRCIILANDTSRTYPETAIAHLVVSDLGDVPVSWFFY